ncbi:MAG: hypothetical protein FWF18_03715 [Dehalococcoidia bacterium]|nr:hypothetical protein [Dehalococcoidia bacterium]
MQKALIAGILSIASGALSLLSGIVLAFLAVFFKALFDNPSIFEGNPSTESLATMFGLIYGILAIFFIILGVLGIVGGIFACQRKRWGWALASAIAAILSFAPAGIAAVILLSIGKQEFDQPATQLK